MSRRPSVFQDGNIGPEIGGRGLAQQSNELNYRRERDAALMKQQKKQNEFDLGMKVIDDAKVADSGLNPVDAIKNKAIPALQSEAFRRLQAGESAMSLKAWLDPQVAKLNEAYVTAKNSKAIIDDNLKQIAKDYEGGDIAKVKNGAYADATSDILEMDNAGNYIGIKDVSVIPHDKNYTSKFLDPQNIGSWYNANGKLKDFAEGLKLNDISDSDKYDNKGKVIKHGYKGKENFLSQKIIDPKTGDVIGQETVHEIVKDKDGNELRVLPDIQEQQILADPRRAAELNQIVASELATAEAATGKPINPEEAHLYMRHRLYQLMDEYKTHTFNKNDEVKIPKPPVYNSHTTINMGKDTQPMGNDFESITAPESGGVKVVDGYVSRTADDSPFTGVIHVTKENIPKTIVAGVKALDKDDDLAVNDEGKVTLKVVDGQIVSALTENGYNFTKDNLTVAQRKLDQSRKDEGPAPFGGGTKNAPIQPKTGKQPAKKPAKDPLNLFN